jgi:hypothetical protein
MRKAKNKKRMRYVSHIRDRARDLGVSSSTAHAWTYDIKISQVK